MAPISNYQALLSLTDWPNEQSKRERWRKRDLPVITALFLKSICLLQPWQTFLPLAKSPIDSIVTATSFLLPPPPLLSVPIPIPFKSTRALEETLLCRRRTASTLMAATANNSGTSSSSSRSGFTGIRLITNINRTAATIYRPWSRMPFLFVPLLATTVGRHPAP